jgi:5-methylcytosine-specific restriction endonuclease McrA
MPLKTLKSNIPVLKSAMQTITPGSWRGDKQGSTQRGYGYKWQQARAGYLLRHPLCVMCQAEKPPRVTAATVVDHIIAHRGNMELFWDRANWQGLCTTHHSSDAQIRDNLTKEY